MAMDRTHNIKSLTDDILARVDAAETQEKTASEKSPEYKSQIARELQSAAQDLRKLAEDCGDVSYEDLQAFAKRVGGGAA